MHMDLCYGISACLFWLCDYRHKVFEWIMHGTCIVYGIEFIGIDFGMCGYDLIFVYVADIPIVYYPTCGAPQVEPTCRGLVPYKWRGL